MIDHDLVRRQGGYGRSGRQKIEKDHIDWLSGMENGCSTGAPIAMRIENRDYANQQKREKPVLTVPRPGHADLAGATKYRLADMRTVLERASARETAMRVAVGALAKRLLGEFGIVVAGQVISIGDEVIQGADLQDSAVRERIEASEDARGGPRRGASLHRSDRPGSARPRHAGRRFRSASAGSAGGPGQLCAMGSQSWTAGWPRQ